jgi:23S rRNA pseudouridine2605 synthase
MVFKRPASSRDDKSSTSSGGHSRRNSGPKKSFSPGRKSASRDSERPRDDREKEGDDRKFKTTSRPYASSGSKPFSKKALTGDRPKSNFDRDAGSEKKSYGTGRSKPNTGRPQNNAPKRSFGNGTSGENKSYSSGRSKPYTGRPTTGDGPKRNFSGAQSGEKKAYPSGGKSYSGRAQSDDRPKRPYSGDAAGARKYGSTPANGAGEHTSEKKYGARPSSTGGEYTNRSSEKTYRTPEDSERQKPRSNEEMPARAMRSRKKAAGTEDNSQIRLNRYISNAGICSRRKADELISAGVISVNGEVVSELGFKVNPMKDVIRYNGETLKREKMVYVLLNKPKDYITTTDDPHERRTVMQLVDKASKERIYPIGRLDRNTTGLLLMTNDGDLADKLSHPKNNITKLYHAELNKSLTQGDLNKISFGIELEDGLIKPDMISYVQGATKKEVGIQIHSGKNRIVRRIFESLDYEVVKLDRVVYANLTKKDLPRGRWRYLTEEEVIQLKHLI